MAGTRTVNGDNCTYTWSFTGPKIKLDPIADESAHQLWDEGKGPHGTDEAPILYASLTVTQKIQILNSLIAETLYNLALTHKALADTNAARLTAIEYANSNYKLE